MGELALDQVSGGDLWRCSAHQFFGPADSKTPLQAVLHRRDRQSQSRRSLGVTPICGRIQPHARRSALDRERDAPGQGRLRASLPLSSTSRRSTTSSARDGARRSLLSSPSSMTSTLDVRTRPALAQCHTAGIWMSAGRNGPPPPPESNGEGAEIWNRVERRVRARVRQSRGGAERCLDHWDEAVDAGDEDDVGAILSALLRERLGEPLWDRERKPEAFREKPSRGGAFGGGSGPAFLADSKPRRRMRERENPSRGIRDRLAPPRDAPANDRRRVAGSSRTRSTRGTVPRRVRVVPSATEVEPGDAETVFDPSEGVDVIDLSVGTSGKAAIPLPVSATGLGEAVGDGMRWRDTSTAPWGQTRSSRRTPDRRTNARSHGLAHARRPSAPRPLRTDADILAGARRPGGHASIGGQELTRWRAGATPRSRIGLRECRLRGDRGLRDHRERSANLDAQLRERRHSRKTRGGTRRGETARKHASPASKRVIDLDVEDGSLASAAVEARGERPPSLRGQNPHGRGRSREWRLTEVAPLWFRNGPSRRGNRPGSKTSSPQRCDGHSLTSRPLRPTRISSQTRQKGTGHQASRRRARTSRCLFRHFSPS